jgi:hypothetical protein
MFLFLLFQPFFFDVMVDNLIKRLSIKSTGYVFLGIHMVTGVLRVVKVCFITVFWIYVCLKIFFFVCTM